MAKTQNYLDPRNDVVFKCLFGARGNEKITKDFLEHIIGEKIEEITTDWKLELDRSSTDDKQMVRDLVAKDKNLKKYIIEMQRKAYEYLPKRFVGYISKTYVADIKVAEDYNTLQKTVLVVIMEDGFYGLEDMEEYHTIWKYTEQKHKKRILEDTTEIHIIELDKYEKQRKETKQIDPWLEFFIDPYGKEVEEMARTREQLQAAVDQLNLLSADEEVRMLADAQDFARLDKNSQIKEETAKARAKGMAEGRTKGIAEGKAEGRAEGLAEGMVEGEKNKAKEIAKKMIEKGMEISEIANITGLSKEEIESIR